MVEQVNRVLSWLLTEWLASKGSVHEVDLVGFFILQTTNNVNSYATQQLAWTAVSSAPSADLAHLYISGALLLMCHVVSGVGRPGSRIAATLNTEYEGFASLWASDNENTLIHDDTHFVPKYKFFF